MCVVSDGTNMAQISALGRVALMGFHTDANHSCKLHVCQSANGILEKMARSTGTDFILIKYTKEKQTKNIYLSVKSVEEERVDI